MLPNGVERQIDSDSESTPDTQTATGAPEFAHPSEAEFARILDFYGIKWSYEPRSFPIRWDGDHVAEMFTPDFYLPDLDLYVELTTMKQSLVTKKNRKLRLIRELYPDINIKLFYRKDYRHLLAKYGLRAGV
ncbi:MAG: hypothetical protein M1319_05515 [Chloroflexi bacterium]|nr:hypothetical protein [Chloroflexota bacterium]